MVFPFGVSVSDLIEGIKLFKNAIEALSDTRGAREDYMELSRSLSSLEKALSAASAVNLDTDARRVALKTTVDNCHKCVTTFLIDIAEFELLRDPMASKRRLVTGFRKVQWAICKKKDIMEFRSQIEMHVGAIDMLLLTFQVESLMRVESNIHDTNRMVVSIDDQLQECLTQQRAVSKKADEENVTQGKRITFLEEEAASRASKSKEEGNILLDIQQKLQNALSPEDQQMIFHFFQEMLKKNEIFERQIEELKDQNKCLERHILEIKASVQVQRNIPRQVLLQQPVILHDALGRIAPFHLEFISSAAALIAILKVRFRYVGLRKIISKEYGLRDANKQTEIDTSQPWESVFLPGQQVEMSMLFPGDGVERNHCPGCSFQDSREFLEGEQVKCPQCPMYYRRTRKAMEFVGVQANNFSATINKERPDQISSFCRVDVVESEKPVPECVQHSNFDRSWYCCECGDGPHSIGIHSSCPICNHSLCTNCMQ